MLSTELPRTPCYYQVFNNASYLYLPEEGSATEFLSNKICLYISVQKEEICEVNKGFTLLLTDIHIAVLVGQCILSIKHMCI